MRSASVGAERGSPYAFDLGGICQKLRLAVNEDRRFMRFPPELLDDAKQHVLVKMLGMDTNPPPRAPLPYAITSVWRRAIVLEKEGRRYTSFPDDDAYGGAAIPMCDNPLDPEQLRLMKEAHFTAMSRLQKPAPAATRSL